jgi:hypothetical protein
MSGKVSDRELTARLYRLLKQRHLGKDGGNGDAWAYFTEVRNQTGYSRGTIRSADAIAMSLWPSRGLLLHGFEVKASRADWLRELREPGKADDFIRHCDHWWLVTEPGVVEAGELPKTWGHLERRGSKLVQKVAAPNLEPEDCSPTFLAALLRAAGRRADVTPEQIADAVKNAREETRKAADERVEMYEGKWKTLRDEIETFTRESGLTLNGRWPAPYGPKELGAAVKLVLEGEARSENYEMRLTRIAEQAQKIASEVQKFVALPPVTAGGEE